MTITEFLEARISEDEAVVERRGSFPHSIHSSDIMGTFSPHCADCLGLPGRARVVAECAAKREVLEFYLLIGSRPLKGDPVRAGMFAGLGEAVATLASVYKDHPDYLAEWDG